MAKFKNEDTLQNITAICRIESIADKCYEGLRLLTLPSNRAVWLLLTAGIKFIEAEIDASDDGSPAVIGTLVNVGRLLPVAINWATLYGAPSTSTTKRRWINPDAGYAEEAVLVAYRYNTFQSSFPMWHRCRYAAELKSSSEVMFTAGSLRERQVSAYQKGYRPRHGSHAQADSEKVEQSARSQQLFWSVLKTAKRTALLQFEYNDPWELWFEMMPQYQKRLEAIARREDSLTLGAFTLREFKLVYAALLAVCATHEFLCFMQKSAVKLYPFDSAVMTRSASRWAQILASLSGVAGEKCASAVHDLTFNSRSVDIHINPFIPLGSTASVALVPQFPLSSHFEENILRICSVYKPTVFNVASLTKESEAISLLQNRIPFRDIQGPISLPNPVPDVDILIAEVQSRSTIVIAEFKWIRKPTRYVERTDRDEEVLKGINQLRQIRTFLSANPEHLLKLGKIDQVLTAYDSIHYILVCRDHWLWIEPNDGVAIVDFEEFSAALAQEIPLASAIERLLRYEWLPVEGRDYTVTRESETVNGVSIESEVYRRL